MTGTIIDRANGLAGAGRSTEGIALLRQAGRAGDAVAMVELAIWFLANRYVPRDTAQARAIMGEAAGMGHVDAALMEAAMVANGSGVPSDWQAALALLRKAAARDEVAIAQLALIDAMRLAPDGSPRSVPPGETLNATPRVKRIRGLLNEVECTHVAQTAAQLLEPALILDPQTGRQRPHPIRTSDGGAIGPLREDLVIRAINRRIAAASGTQVEQGEPLTILRYRPGQQYRPHHDTIAGAANQRVTTVLIYLNQGFGGGETVFPLLKVSVTPAAGDALVFDSTLDDGKTDERARHAGLPVTNGTKWLATRWIRARPIDAWSIAETG